MNKEISLASQFVPYELSLKLKNIGFNEPCFGGWDDDKIWYYHPDSDIIVDAPLWQQAFDWFREKHSLHALNSPLLNNEWSVVIDNTLNSNQVYWSKRVGYQEARQDCLEKLIEICKNQ